MVTTVPSGARFEIKVDGIVRTHRDQRDIAIEAARFLQLRNLTAKIIVIDLRDGSNVSFERRAQRPPTGCPVVEEWFEGDRYETLRSVARSPWPAPPSRPPLPRSRPAGS